jgi:hypothetical protein
MLWLVVNARPALVAQNEPSLAKGVVFVDRLRQRGYAEREQI